MHGRGGRFTAVVPWRSLLGPRHGLGSAGRLEDQLLCDFLAVMLRSLCMSSRPDIRILQILIMVHMLS